MKRLTLAALLVLASCAPTATSPAPASNPMDPAPAVLKLALDPQRIRFEVGASPATLRHLVITGQNLHVNDDRCKPDGLDVVCLLNFNVPAGFAFGLQVTGTNIHGKAEYIRGAVKPYTASF